MFCVEATGVWFEDLLVVRPVAADTTVVIDPLFIEVCEPGTIRPVAVVADVPTLCGAKIMVDGHLHLLVRGELPGEALVTIRGIRKGFANVRLTPATEAEARRNEEFWHGWKRP